MELKAPFAVCLANFKGGRRRREAEEGAECEDMAGQRENIFMQDIFSVRCGGCSSRVEHTLVGSCYPIALTLAHWHTRANSCGTDCL